MTELREERRVAFAAAVMRDPELAAAVTRLEQAKTELQRLELVDGVESAAELVTSLLAVTSVLAVALEEALLIAVDARQHARHVTRALERLAGTAGEAFSVPAPRPRMVQAWIADLDQATQRWLLELPEVALQSGQLKQALAEFEGWPRTANTLAKLLQRTAELEQDADDARLEEAREEARRGRA